MQRLHAQPVAREEQALPPRIMQREGEHAVQAIEHRRTPGRPAVEQHLGIARRHEHRAKRLQFGTQRGEIVNLAVIGDGQRAVGARHRLGRAGDIDDREAAMPKAHARRSPHARPVRPAMRLRVRHRLNPRRIDRLGGGRVIKTGDAAHQARLPIPARSVTPALTAFPPRDRRCGRSGRAPRRNAPSPRADRTPAWSQQRHAPLPRAAARRAAWLARWRA